mmetsp:Transcript_11892/g.23019  ORF Transcript_11892/g.23019 Transcript_11892/m.23019 type:complete len:1066 (+) Transcript_11892:173-3370(+)
MANKTTKKAKRQGGKHAAEGHNADGTTDERFSAAETRPQFSSGRRRRNHKEEEDGGGNVNNDDNSDDELEKRPHRRDDDDDYDDGEGGFGHSLAEAIKSDDRFKEALSNQEKFGCVPLLDKYGRKTKQAKKMKKRAKNEKQSKTGSENEDEDEDENEIENENDQSTKSKNNKAKVKSKKAKGQSDSESEDEAVNGNENMGQQKEEDEEEDPLESNDMESRIAYLNALSRGEIDVSSSHDDDSSSDEDDNNDDDDDDDSDRDDASSSSTSSTSSVHGKAGVLDPSYNRLPGDFADQNEVDYDGRIIELTDEATPYLAILNLDWTNVRAVDVFAMLHSFCPPGTLKKVEVYPSDFGRKMMEKERVEGPSGLWKDYKQKMKNRNNNEAEGKESLDDDDDEDGRDDSDSDSDNCSESTDEDDEPVDAEDSLMPGEYDSDNDDDEHSNEEDMSDEEDILNIDEATAKLYSHFPHQSQLKSNNKHKSRNTTNLPEDEDDEGFDHEKLRAYEASKLRYYFAIATFTSPQAANDVYNHVDGMEMEHSAAEIDVRALPAEQYDETIEGRTLRDECTSLPAKYAPPDSVVTALRQSKVTCSWETGDAERENKLTRYGMGKEAWEALAGGDDIKFYLASDHSSADEDESEDGDESEDDSRGGGNKGNKEAKAKNVRALLGLGGSDDDDDDGMENGGLLAGRHESVSADSSRDNNESDVEQTEGVPTTKQSIKKLDQKSRHDSSDSEASEDDEEGETAKQVTYTPGKRNLEERIRSKLQSKQAVENGEQPDGGLTPFQKYLEKRKEKRRERRQAIRNKKKNQEENGGDASGEDGDGMYEVDPEFGVAQFSDEEEGDDDVMRDGGDNDDGFFLGESKKSKAGKSKKHKESLDEAAEEREKGPSTKEELELLIDGDDDEENEKDYDMRGLAKLEKNANKKLKGKRKRQMETLAANVSGQEFKIDTTDDRFAALLDGSDDRFGIDRTNPLYKETGAMKTLLEEQAKRRKKNQAKKTSSLENVEGVTELNKRAAANDGGGWVESSGGAMELSSLVKSLQNKISKKAAEEKPMKEKTKQHGQ